MKECVFYTVVTYSQVLYSGTWEDGDWDWELKEVGSFKNLKDAQRCIDKIEISNDLSLARIFKITERWDGEDYDRDKEVLFEKD